jgi:3-deoxy-D-manno-octulosonic-acid transferase
VIYPVYTALVTTALVAAYGPAAVARRLLHGVPLNLRQRLALGSVAPATRSAWVHAVSVGEAIAAAPLVAGLRQHHPQLPLVMTTVTETGARVVRERYAGQASHRFFPLDVPGAVRRAVDAIDPAFLITMETELWPNVLRHLAARGVPVMIANGRLSDRSYPRYRLARRFMRRVLDGVTVFAMQSDEDARRVIALGARPERVFVTGNLKHEPLPHGSGPVDLWRHLFGLRSGQLVWIAGSTHRGEEEMVLDAHRSVAARVPGLALILAPRHPERVPEVLKLLATRGVPAVRRTELPRAASDGAVTVLDTVGELAQLYVLADVVFVGGSLVDIGGHNVLEPALHGKPVLFGPHTQNFRDAAALLLERGGACRVEDAVTLERELDRLIHDAEVRARMGRAAHDAVRASHGAVRETLDLVTRFLVAGRCR